MQTQAIAPVYHFSFVLCFQFLSLYSMEEMPLKSPTGDDVIFLAALEGGDEQNLKRSWSRGVNINTCDENGQTALHKAVISSLENNYKWFTKLLEKGACIAALDKEGFTPMHYILQQENIKLLDLACAQLALIKGCLCGKSGCTLTALKNKLGQTLLHSAALQNYLEAARCLLKHRLEVDAKDNTGKTPLFLAASNGYRPMVELLLRHGANRNVVDDNGIQPWYYAAENQHEEIAELLKPEEKPSSRIVIPSKTSYISARAEADWKSMELSSATSTRIQNRGSETAQEQKRRRGLLFLLACCSSNSHSKMETD